MTRRTASTVALALAGLLLSACTGEGDRSGGESPTPTEPTTSPSVSETPEPPAAPRAGACYRLTVRKAARPTNQSEPVGCDSAHTARTIHVGQLDLVVNGHAVAVDSRLAQRQLERTCPAQLARFLGGDAAQRALTRFQVVWFSPTLEEADLGATWFRCDVIAFGDGERLLTLPAKARLKGVLDRPEAAAAFGLCGTSRPGEKGFRRVACSLPHSWRAISTVPLEGGRAYPGAQRLREAGDETCADQARAEQGQPLEFSYGWEWPTREQWAAGQRYGFCWSPA